MRLFYLTIVLFFSLSSNSFAVEVPKPEAEKGMLVFYRMAGFGGSAIRFIINGSKVSPGMLASGTYIFKNAEPGPHSFWAQALSKDSININVEVGKTYYIKGEVKMGIYAGRPKFQLVDESQALQDLEKF